jgi:transcriptional regulator with XRE-family HTH domain
MTDLAAANRAILDLYTLIGRNVVAAREQHGTIQADLAAAVGLTRSSITNIEAGRQRTSVHVLIAIAQALGVELTDLLGPDLPVIASKAAGVDKLRRRLISTRAQLDLVIANLEGAEAP